MMILKPLREPADGEMQTDELIPIVGLVVKRVPEVRSEVHCGQWLGGVGEQSSD